MAPRKTGNSEPGFVLVVPGGEIHGRDEARAWLENEREAALSRAQQPGADTLGSLARALTCNRAMQLLEEQKRLDFTRLEPATVADVIEVFRQA